MVKFFGSTFSLTSSANDYTKLKWPLSLASVLTTIITFIILISFRSNEWFQYEFINVENATSYQRTLEFGTFGLWTLCTGYIYRPTECAIWTGDTRPEKLNIILILIAGALFVANLTVFPSWGTTVLIIYNQNNRYIRHIAAFVYAILAFTLVFTVLMVTSMIIVALTKFYNPGQFVLDTKHLYFNSGSGLYWAEFATVLSIISLILIIVTIVWRKYIEIQRYEAEKELLRQISDDNYKPGWHKIRNMAPQTPISTSADPPPSYTETFRQKNASNT